MALTKEDILQGFTPPTGDGNVQPLFSPEDLKRAVIEDQVADLRQEAAKGKKPPVVTPRAPNPKQEAISGSKTARVVGPPPGFLETGLEGVGGAAGATAGSLYGAQLGAPFGPAGLAVGGMAGGVIGAGLGLAGTRAGVEGAKAAVGARPPITADEAVNSGGRALIEGAAGELLFRPLAGIPSAYHGLKQRLLASGMTDDAFDVYKRAQGMGIHLTPSTLTDSKAPKMVESTLRRTLGGSGKFNVNDINNELALRKGVDDWADQTLGQFTRQGDDPAMSAMRYGDIVQKAIKGEVIPEQKQFVKALYTNLDQQTGGAAIVDPTALYGELQTIRASLAKRGEKTFSGAIEALDHVMERITKKGNVTGLTVKRLENEQGLAGLKVKEKSDAPRQPRSLTFSEAQEIRSIIGSEIGHDGPALPGSEVEKLKKAYALMSQHMGEAAMDFTKATGKDINLSWLLADTMNKRGKQLFNESIVARAVEQKPEDVVKVVFQKNAISETRELVRALENKPEALGAYRRGVVEHLIQEATDKTSERVVGTDFAKAARKRGEAVLKETFGENYDGFKKILEVAERMPKQSQSGMLWFEQGLFVRAAVTALPVVGAVAGSVADSPSLMAASLAAPAAWFLSTRSLSNILTNKELTNKLLGASKMNLDARALGRVMTQLGAIEVGETGRPMEGATEPRRGVISGIGQRLME